jgi:hypothetical protein
MIIVNILCHVHICQKIEEYYHYFKGSDVVSTHSGTLSSMNMMYHRIQLNLLFEIQIKDMQEVACLMKVGLGPGLLPHYLPIYISKGRWNKPSR